LKKLRTLKLDIARIKTVARERELGTEKPAAVAAAPAKSTRKKAKKD
jgi:large subunit ribosomal protein L29